MFNLAIRTPLLNAVGNASVALGLAVAAGLAAAPAQAATVFSQLSYSDGTTDFYSEFLTVLGSGGTFDVDFLSTVFLSSATGDLDFFATPGLATLTSDTLTFTKSLDQTDSASNPLAPGVTRFELVNPVTFDVNGDVQVFLPETTTFLFTQGINQVQAQFDFVPTTAPALPTVTTPNYVFTPLDPQFTFITSTLGFSDTSLVGPGGTYQGIVNTKREMEVPEPSTVLSLLAIGGLGLVSRQKKQR